MEKEMYNEREQPKGKKVLQQNKTTRKKGTTDSSIASMMKGNLLRIG
jgi:hypothetical protein